MNLFLLMPVWIGVISLFFSKSNACFMPAAEPDNIRKPYFLFACFAVLPIYLFASFGDPYGDTLAYIGMYQDIGNKLSSGLQDYLNYAYGEKGFAIFSYVIYFISSGSVLFYRGLIGLIHIIPIILIFKRYSCNYLLSVFLFIASGGYFGWMMNGIRQFMAATIIFAATPLLVKKNYFYLIIVILLAVTLHKTALIMIPIIFIVNGEAFNKHTVLCLAVSLFLTWLFARNASYYDDFSAMAGYGKSVQEMRLLGDDGCSIIRVLVSFVPCALAWQMKQKIKEKKDPFLNICVNMSVLSTGMYMISAVTSGIMIGRLPGYISLYNCILLPWLTTRICDKQHAVLLTVAMIICYLIYYPIEISFVLL